jgi:hypothetical protein
MIKQASYWLLLLSLMISQTALALRCGSYVINEGMYKAEVYSKCGQATSIDSHIETRSTGTLAQNQQYYGGQRNSFPNSSFGYGQNNTVQVDIIVDEWIYNFGPSRLQQYLRFENGKLMEIRNLSRGYRNQPMQ